MIVQQVACSLHANHLYERLRCLLRHLRQSLAELEEAHVQSGGYAGGIDATVADQLVHDVDGLLQELAVGSRHVVVLLAVFAFGFCCGCLQSVVVLYVQLPILLVQLLQTVAQLFVERFLAAVTTAHDEPHTDSNQGNDNRQSDGLQFLHAL